MYGKISTRADREKNVMIHSGSYPGGSAKGVRWGRVSRRHARYRGIGLVWTAIYLLLILLIVGLSLDTGKVAYNWHQMQNAADAAALAGAQVVQSEDADATRQLTHDIALANSAEGLPVTLRYQDPYVQPEPFVDDTNLDIILGRWVSQQQYFFPTLDAPDAVKVIARRADGLANAPALSLVFGPMAGVSTANASRVAVGWHYTVDGAGLIVLDTDPKDKNGNPIPGLYVAGTGDIRVEGGNIHVNSTAQRTVNDGAVYVWGSGQMQCGRLTVSGQSKPAPGDTRWESIWTDDLGVSAPYDITEGAGYMPDPLAYLVAPPIPTDPDTGAYIVASNQVITGGTLNPGYYPRGIDVTGGATVTLNAGTYWLGGGYIDDVTNDKGGLYMNGGFLQGLGVLIYLTKDYVNVGGKWAELDIQGNVTMDIRPPGDMVNPQIKNGLEGVSIWQDRSNPTMTTLGGGGGMMIQGTLYFPNNHIYLAGTPGKAGNQIICGSVEVHGRAPIVVEYDGRNGHHRGRSMLVQ